MLKLYFKQAWRLLRENPVLSAISILGTALAICMIMVMVIIYGIQTKNYMPETNRNRMMYFRYGEAKGKEGIESGSNYGRLGIPCIKSALYTLKSAEAVTATSLQTYLASVPGVAETLTSYTLLTDDAFWKVFNFRFIAGKPFSREDFSSGIKKAVIDETTARKLYGNANAVGKTLFLSHLSYTVCGVVKDVSSFARAAYANVWIPYTNTAMGDYSHADGIMGSFQCYLLAHSSADFSKIKSEVLKNVQQYNQTTSTWNWGILNQPNSVTEMFFRKGMQSPPEVGKGILRYAVLLLILLLVPALNLSGLTLSRTKQRYSELGVRRAFGAVKQQLISQVLLENFVLSLLGGILGLAFSYVGLFLLRGWLLKGVETIYADMLVSPWVFVLAFLFCLLLNLFSAYIPAYRASRKNIVDALHN